MLIDVCRLFGSQVACRVGSAGMEPNSHEPKNPPLDEFSILAEV